MMRTRTTKSKVLALCLMFAVAAAAAGARGAVETQGPAAQCSSVFAVEQYALTTTDCPSPVGFCAAGTFKGNHGFRGNSFYSAVSFDAIPSDSLGRLVVPGVLTYTTDGGVINVDDVSVFDVA